MAKTKKQPAHPQVPKTVTEATSTAAPQVKSQPFRETIESFAIAIVLAFLIRTFAAEAFVIPTGSMANTLMGQHQDVYCVQCGQRYQVSASDEQDDSILKGRRFGVVGPVTNEERIDHATVAGTCSNCRDTMLYSSQVPKRFLNGGLDVENLGQPYGGDRILVNKFVYDFQQPERWDVIVFRYPGEANVNYIKRLVGLPNELVRVYHGDVFIGARDVPPDAPFSIARKPADKVLAVRELVHDTAHDAAALYDAGWPLRWQVDGSVWKQSVHIQDRRALQKYEIEEPANEIAWIRYEHTPASVPEWVAVHERPAGTKVFKMGQPGYPRPELVGDFNAYNSNVQRQVLNSLRDATELQYVDASNGIHWVGDLILEADVSVTSEQGELVLDLVKGGRHFVCRIDLSTGKATLGIEEFETRAPVAGYGAQAETAVRGAGEYDLRFANVDEQLLLWVNGKLVEFPVSTAYDYEKLFGNRQQNIPRASDTDRGDLAPAGIGARGASVVVDRLQVSRDIYYIAAKDQSNLGFARQIVSDYSRRPSSFQRLFEDPQEWDLFRDRQTADFPLGDDQFFVMGDNSPASQDARLWKRHDPRDTGPAGNYLDVNLLIGKAVFVYWPHSWYGIPGTPIPLWPNFRDMRLVR